MATVTVTSARVFALSSGELSSLEAMVGFYFSRRPSPRTSTTPAGSFGFLGARLRARERSPRDPVSGYGPITAWRVSWALVESAGR